MGSGRGWLAGDWPSTGGILNINAAAWTAGFQLWRSGNITQTQNVTEYILVLAVCLVALVISNPSGPAKDGTHIPTCVPCFAVFCFYAEVRKWIDSGFGIYISCLLISQV